MTYPTNTFHWIVLQLNHFLKTGNHHSLPVIIFLYSYIIIFLHHPLCSNSHFLTSSHHHCCPTSADWSPVCQSSRFLFIFIAGHLPFTHQSHSDFQSIYNFLSFLLSLSCIHYSAASGECFKLWQENFSKFSS